MKYWLHIVIICTMFVHGHVTASQHCFPCVKSLMKEIAHPPESYFPQGSRPPKPNFQIFPVSSEIQIGKIQHMIQRVPCGMYLTVGAERGFRAASMSDKITALYLLDIHDDIIRYNKINRELLKAPFRQVYLDLRWDTPFSEWQKLFEEVQRLFGYVVPITEDDFVWWQKNVRDLNREAYVLPESLNRLNKAPPCESKDVPEEEKAVDLGQVIDYKSGNYLFYDDLYNRIHRLAIQNRIYTSKINLMDQQQVQTLVEYIRESGLTLSVLDLDNLFHKDYMGQDAYHQLLPQFIHLGEETSVLLVMDNYKNYGCAQFQLYLAFTFGNVEDWPETMKMQDFLASIPTPVQELIDGRLYEAGEALPDFAEDV